jgi:hypothetical protein
VASSECSRVSPSLLDDLNARRLALREEPRPIEILGYGTDVEDEALFLYSLAHFISEQHFRYRIPRAVHEAVGGDNDRWNAMLSEIFQVPITDGANASPRMKSGGLEVLLPARRHGLGEFVARGLYMTILCAEYLPNSPGPERLWEIYEEQEWPDSTFATVADICEHWEVEPVDASLRHPVLSLAPSLLMSGQFDLNTVPEWGDHVAETLPNSTHLVVPMATHYTLWDSCPAQIVTDYLLAGGDPGGVDTSCLEVMPHPGW